MVVEAQLDPLEGVALVTGGGRGIGRSIAIELAAAGMRVAITGRTATEVADVAKEVGGLALPGDVSQPADVERWLAQTETSFGSIDLLVNNAAILGDSAPLWTTNSHEWWHIFEVNVRGPFLCSHEVLPGMIERRRGRIVNVTSRSAYLSPQTVASGHSPGADGFQAFASTPGYSASKAALSRFSEELERQTAPFGVHIFQIRPGLVRTSMSLAGVSDPNAVAWTPPERASMLVRVIASGRADVLAGRFLDAEDDIEELIERADEVVRDDLNAIRLRR